MQNKPNFLRSKMNVKSYNTNDYENKWQRKVRKNKPNSNPIKPNLKRAKMNINLFIIKDYRKKDDFEVRINKPNFRKAQNERKLICSKGLQKKNDFAVQKNKPNSNPISESYPDAAARSMQLEAGLTAGSVLIITRGCMTRRRIRGPKQPLSRTSGPHCPPAR